MRLIIPMAGVGKRMRPHTLNTPKPLIKIAGRSIVKRIIQDFVSASGKKIDEINFIIGNFGEEVEQELHNLAADENIGSRIYYQKEPLGTGHAIYCAAEALQDEICVVFADTLYEGDLKIESEEAVIWTKKVEDPEHYGVVITDNSGSITAFAEKPKDRISDLAIVGMYYFKRGEILAKYLKTLIDQGKTVQGEFQLTDALIAMLNDGIKFKSKELINWLDFGNKGVFLESIGILLNREEYRREHTFAGSQIKLPVYLGENVTLLNSVIGPNVIIESNTNIIDSQISDTRIGSECIIENSTINTSLIGNHCKVKSLNGSLNIGDYNEVDG